MESQWAVQYSIIWINRNYNFFERRLHFTFVSVICICYYCKLVPALSVGKKWRANVRIRLFVTVKYYCNRDILPQKHLEVLLTNLGRSVWQSLLLGYLVSGLVWIVLPIKSSIALKVVISLATAPQITQNFFQHFGAHQCGKPLFSACLVWIVLPI